jgi:hypothetical protein
MRALIRFDILSIRFLSATISAFCALISDSCFEDLLAYIFFGADFWLARLTNNFLSRPNNFPSISNPFAFSNALMALVVLGPPIPSMAPL